MSKEKRRFLDSKLGASKDEVIIYVNGSPSMVRIPSKAKEE